MDHILTFDLGTSYFKAMVVSPVGDTVSLARVPTPMTTPAPGRQEMDPARVLNVLSDLATQLRAQSAAAWKRISHVSYSTQTNTFLLVDRADKPVTPLIVWSDQRAHAEYDPDAPPCPIDAMPARTGVPHLMCEFMPPKLLWIQRHMPRAWERTSRVLLLSDFVTLWLTGEPVTEAGAAGLTGLLDIRALAWRTDALQACSLNDAMLCSPVRSGARIGPLRAQAAEALGLSPHARLIAGGLDQYMGAMGAGVYGSDRVVETTGTVLAAVRYCPTIDAAHADSFHGPAHAEGGYFQMRFGSISANLLEQYQQAQHDRPTFEQLDALATRAGEADSSLTASHEFDQRGRAVYAIYTRVAEALDAHVRHLCPNEQPSEIRSLGGAAKSDVWLQLKADVLGCRFERLAQNEAAAYGAAIVAGASASEVNAQDLAERWVRVEKTFFSR